METTQQRRVSRTEIARLAGVSPRTITRWMQSGKLPFRRDELTGRLSFAPEDLRTESDATSGP